MSLELFTEMLQYMRPAGSKAERNFIKRYIKPLEVEQDAFGNLYKRVGTAPILWSSHTDTVHITGGKQAVDIDANGWLTAPLSNCLGADCTTGVYLMREMILAGVEGLYVFHRAEEVGGQGSAWIAKNTPQLLEGIKFAIAFDRKDMSSIITFQFGERCCSDGFGKSLMAQLGDGWALDDGGTFTDTANYVDLIGECTNLSVGYYDQHTRKERQSWPFLLYLLDRLKALDVNALVQARNPGDSETLWGAMPNDFTSPKAWNTWMDDGTILFNDLRDPTRTNAKGRNHRYLVDTILDHPDAVADMLNEYGISSDDILAVVAGCR